jgi:hypothetical protein
MGGYPKMKNDRGIGVRFFYLFVQVEYSVMVIKCSVNDKSVFPEVKNSRAVGIPFLTSGEGFTGDTGGVSGIQNDDAHSCKV